MNYRTHLHRVEGNLTGITPSTSGHWARYCAPRWQRSSPTELVLLMASSSNTMSRGWTGQHSHLIRPVSFSGTLWDCQQEVTIHRLVTWVDCFTFFSWRGRRSSNTPVRRRIFTHEATLLGLYQCPWRSHTLLTTFISSASMSEFQKEECVQITSNYSCISSLFHMKLWHLMSKWP